MPSNPLNSISGNIIFFGLLTLASSLLYWSLFLIKNGGKRNILKRLLYIPANKSHTRTLLLGGLPLNFSFLILILTLPYVFNLGLIHRSIIDYSLILFLGVLVYGYLDDRFEIRAILKLFFQVSIVSIFSYLICKVLYPENTVVPFLLNFVIGMMVINGANLLDGLDTLSFKIFAVSLGYFAYVALTLQPSSLVVFLVTGSLFATIPFYFLNRAPAKVYLGEIGAGSFASMLLLISNLLYLEMKASKFPSFSFVSASFPLMIFGVELSVSFLRRFLNKRSPFKGDKLHVHHLLMKVYQFTPSTVGTLYGISQALLCLVGFWSLSIINHWLSFSVVLTSLLLTYFLLGRKFWVGQDFIPMSISSLFNLSLKKKVKIISDSALNDFQVYVVDPDSDKSKTINGIKRCD